MSNMKDTDCTLPPYLVHDIGQIETLSQNANWAISDLDIPSLWADTEGEGVTVAIIDTGVPNHIDLNDNILLDKCRSFIDDEDMWDNSAGHASHVSGLVAALDNAIGVVGVAPKTKLVCLKALNKYGSSKNGSIEKALQYCIDIKPDIINMSLGGTDAMPAAHELIKKLYAANVMMVCSAGNNGQTSNTSVLYPAKYDEVLAVGSYGPTSLKSRSVFSSFGAELDICAPGEQLLSTYMNNKYAVMSGTSQASPIVSAIIALVISYFKKKGLPYNNKIITDMLLSNCVGMTSPGRDNDYGWGLISPKKLFNQLNPSASIQSITESRFSRYIPLWLQRWLTEND